MLKDVNMSYPPPDSICILLILSFVFFIEGRVAEKVLRHIDVGQTHAVNIEPHPDVAFRA